MAKKITGYVKLQIPAGQATPAPPVGPALGQHGVNIMDFCKAFNARTQKQVGTIIPVVITVFSDRTYTFITKTPPASFLLRQAAGRREGLGRAKPQEGREGHQGAGRGDRQDQAARPQHDLARGCDSHHRRHCPQHGHRESSHKGGRPVKHSKKFAQAKSKVETRRYELREAIELMREIRYAKFDETVEVAMRLGVDPRHADQMVRGTVVLPHGTGKSKRVLVVAVGEQAKEAQEAGADFVMGEEVIEKIQGGWLDFEAMVATPDMMRHLSKLGKILGPRGLMPNPKTGTVTAEVGKAVREIKAGKVEFRVDKTAIIHAPVGKVSFSADALEENARSLITAILQAKPSAAKGKYVQSAFMSSTMGPGVCARPVSPLETK